MAQQKLPLLSARSLNVSLAATGIPLITCLALILGQAFLTTLDPLIGLTGVAAIALIIFFFILPELALPLYILVAGPSLVLSASSSGILSRLYIGDLLFVLIVGIWLLREISSVRKSRQARFEMSILVPLLCLAIIGFISIISSHLTPDPHVTYAFAHSD